MGSEISSSTSNSASVNAAQPARSSAWAKAQRIGCWALAVGVAVWSLTDSRFRNAEGGLRGTVCLPLATVIALALLGYALDKAWRTAAVWMSLALIGQATALQMIEAGQQVYYQHYRPLGVLLTASPWLVALLGAQTLLTLFGIRKRWSVIKFWLGRNFKLWQAASIALVFSATSATVSRKINLYIEELPLATFIQAINLLNLVLAVWAIPEAVLDAWRWRVERITGWDEEENGRVDRFAVTAAVGATVLAVLLSVFSYQRHPHLGDEIAYLYQARYLATGQLTMPTPAALEAFDLDLFDHDATRWWCSPPVGWPLVLAIGVLLKADWLVNPVLAGVCVWLAFVLVKELYDRRTARLTALLLALSPWHVLIGMSYMTHTASLAFGLLAALAAVWARKNESLLWALASGAATGMVGMIRPLEGTVVAAVIGVPLGLSFLGMGGKRVKFASLLAWAFGCGVIGAGILYYNFALTGSPTKFPIMVWADKYMGVNSNAMGFGPDRGNGWPIDPYPGHSPLEGVINSNLNITAINTELFGWSIGSLILIALFCVSLKLRSGDWLMAALIAGIFTAHFFYWFSGGPDFAARYWYLMIVPCVVLSVRGLQVLIHRLTHETRQPHLHRTRVLVGVFALSMMALVSFTPWRAIDKYHHYLRMRPDVRQLAKEYNFGKSLVLIRGEQFPDFASAAIYNPIDLQAAEPVYAWDQNPSLQAEVLKQYSDRPVWILNGPSITKAGFQIAEGPVSAQSLLQRQQTASP
ncbi:MAG: glycosyltransferase family 39 protein [Acidobacteria bacterium]|nr:glycosyltransferase family 39 protein [Acidobacteriota bacterium]